MCMEDIAIGRYINVVRSVVNCLTTTTQLVQNNPKRVSLIIANGASTMLTVNDVTPVTSLVGMQTNSSLGDLRLNIWRHGNLVTRAFWGIKVSAATDIIIYEGILDFDLPDPKQLLEMLMRRQYGQASR
jgi:hypothetical protein